MTPQTCAVMQNGQTLLITKNCTPANQIAVPTTARHRVAIRDHAERVFRNNGISTHVVEANKKDSADASTVRFLTMHRAKGLEFDQVLVLAPDRFLGPLAESLNERRLLYVAITRAKRAAALITF